MSLRADDAKAPQSTTSTRPLSPLPGPPGSWPTDRTPVGTSAPPSLSAAVRARKDEYVRKRSIKIKVGTWNVASISGTEKDLGGWFVKGLGVKGLSQDLPGLSTESSHNLPTIKDIETVAEQEERKTRSTKRDSTLPIGDVPAVPHDDEIGLYVLGLQEVVDVASVTEAVKPYTDPNPAKKWKTALRAALPVGYTKVAEQQLLGLLILIFASSTVAPSISSVSCTSVGTGLMGYLGNKGAVSVRLVLAETTRLCFVNCHLAAGADQTALTRRIWDTNQILGRTRFSSVSMGEDDDGPEEKIGDEDFAFWCGDLNFRLDDIPGEDVRRLLLLHTRNEYDVVNKSKRKIDTELGYVDVGSEESSATIPDDQEPPDLPAGDSIVDPLLDPKSDPASLVTTLASLLCHDQLRAQQRRGKAFHEGWQEGEINFLPTYKYDVGSVGMFDSGEKKRSPSWCDRILFRTRADRLRYEEKAKRDAEARKKDEEMKKRGLDEDAAEQDVLFDYDPDADGLAYGDDYDEEADELHDAELVQTHEGFEDEIELDHYVSHQRVLSSDHKPLDATFTLSYDAVIPELKAKIHADVARELDKAENEGRPGIAVVVDSQEHESNSDANGSIEQDDSGCVHFGQVRYRIHKERSITIANTGQNPATFNFVGKGIGAEADLSISAPWLHVEPLTADGHEVQNSTHSSMDCTLSPGDTKTIQLTMDVSDPDFVYKLNHYAEVLEDVLILRVKDGRDHFVPVKGKWLPTCFCRTLDELVLAPERGVRSIPKHPTNRDGTGSGSLKSSPRHHSAPKELFALTETIVALVERSIADWDVLHPNETPPWKHEPEETTWPFDASTWTFHPGDEREALLDEVRENLDTAKPINEHTAADESCLIHLEILAETLVQFLESLRDGVITATLWTSIEASLIAAEKDKTLAAMTAEDIQALVMDPLSSAPVHSVSMTFLSFMLGRIIKEVAPASKEQLKSPTSTGASMSSRRSRASSLLSETGSETSTTLSVEAGNKRSFLDRVRRRGQSISTSTGSAVPTLEEQHNAVLDRRKTLMRNFTALFAPLIIRSSRDASAKGKEKKALEGRKMKVLEAFLETGQL